MAWRAQNDQWVTHRAPTYYANNKLYPKSNAPIQTQTRTSRRMHEGLSIDRNYGIDAVSDDVNSSPFSSPYYVNGRYLSDNLTTQTGNSASVQGMKYLMSINDEEVPYEIHGSATTIKLWQGKQIRFSMPYTGKIVGALLNIKNTGGSSGILSIYLSATEDGPVLAEMAVDLCQVSENDFELQKLHSALVVPWDASPLGTIYVRMEIWDEVDYKRSTNPFNTGRYIEIEAAGNGGHSEWVYELGEKNRPVFDHPDFKPKPSQPALGLIYNSWKSIPVNRIEGVDYGATVSKDKYLYDIYCIENGVEAKVVIYDRQANTIVDDEAIDIPVDARTKGVNIIQATDYVYYVDGYSPLQKFRIGEWKAEEVKSANSPVIAASIITFHNNRIYLSGFRYDPNLVQCTSINQEGPQFDDFPYRFYSPGESPLATSNQPIVAIVEYEADTLMIATTASFALYSSNTNIEDGTPTQVSIHSDGAGVASAGDITSYRGVIYSFDPDEGIRRFTGSLWSKIPAALDTHIERVDMTKPRKLWGYAYKLYFNYTDRIDGKAKCMVWDMAMNYQQYPWFQDIDIPFCDARTENDWEIYGIHPDYPCIMKLYAEDTWARLDTPIEFVRHTKYLSLPGNSDDMILKRVFVKVLANATRWWWLAIEGDRDSLTQTRGNDAWYRMPCWNTVQEEQPVETPFPTQDIYERSATALLPLPNLQMRAISTQVKAKAKTFRSQANLVSVTLEAQARPRV